jgi:hypothetical protein
MWAASWRPSTGCSTMTLLSCDVSEPVSRG